MSPTTSPIVALGWGDICLCSYRMHAERCVALEAPIDEEHQSIFEKLRKFLVAHTREMGFDKWMTRYIG
ncbi:hypothetical protein HBI27_174030 [Parastagonospora nodorum]|nr:hypothetical protein HBI27_174030 [Parastagonospora nodorum]